MIDTKSIYPVKYTHYFPTGIDAIDGLLNGGGLWENETVILGGRPGIGKTAVAAQIAVNLAKSDVKVMYFDLENSEVLLHYFADASKKDEFNLESLELCYNLPATIDSLSSAIEQSDAMVVIIDYAQLIYTNELSIYDALSTLPDGKAYLILSQISKNADSREGHLPNLNDCTEKLEYDNQNATILLHRDSYYEGTPAEEMEVFVYRGEGIRGHGHWLWTPKDYTLPFLKSNKEEIE